MVFGRHISTLLGPSSHLDYAGKCGTLRMLTPQSSCYDLTPKILLRGGFWNFKEGAEGLQFGNSWIFELFRHPLVEKDGSKLELLAVGSKHGIRTAQLPRNRVCVCVDEMLNAEIILGKLSLFRYLKHNLVSGMEPLLTLCKAKEDLYKRHNFFFKIRRYNPGVMEWTVASGVFGQLLLRRVRNFMDSLMDPNCSLTWTIARVLKRTSLKFST